MGEIIECNVMPDLSGHGSSVLYSGGGFNSLGQSNGLGTWDDLASLVGVDASGNNNMSPDGPTQPAGNPNNKHFHFKLDPYHFPVNRFENKPFTVRCTIEVTFDGIDTTSTPAPGGKKTITVDHNMEQGDLVHLLQSADRQEFSTAADFGIQAATESETQEDGQEDTEQETQAQAVILDGKEDSMLIYVVIGVCAVLALLIGGLVMYLRRAGKAKAGGKQNTPITVSVTERITATA